MLNTAIVLFTSQDELVDRPVFKLKQFVRLIELKQLINVQ